MANSGSNLEDRALPSSTVSTTDRLSRRVINAYCFPTIAVGSIMILASLYLMKFATDVLLIAPGAAGAIFGVGRIWDAITDPIVGYASDRSRSSIGRRRLWMYLSAIPIAVTLIMVWTPPASLTGVALVFWMTVAIFMHEAAATMYLIPHGALGVELTADYHERNRLYGYRHIYFALGMGLGVICFDLIRSADDQRAMALQVSSFLAILAGVSILLSTRRMTERAENMGRGGENIYRAFRDVFKNPHARVLLLVYGIETFGVSTIAVLAIYVMEYILKAPEATKWFILCYFLPQFGLTPMWMALGRRFQKKHLWITAMWIHTFAFSSLFFVAEDRHWLTFIQAFIIGIAGGAGAIFGPAIQADVIDYDEYQTGERKEGAYLAVWNFVRKASAGLTVVLTGFMLQFLGFVPNQEQDPGTLMGMRMLFGPVPGICYLAGTLIFLRFSLNAKEHARIRAALKARRSSGSDLPEDRSRD